MWPSESTGAVCAAKGLRRLALEEIFVPFNSQPVTWAHGRSSGAPWVDPNTSSRQFGALGTWTRWSL